MSKHKHVMIDLETLGTRAGAAILQIGAVEFDALGPKDVDDKFRGIIGLGSCVQEGLHVEEETVEWWIGQGRQARAWVACSGDRNRAESLPHALRRLSAWLAVRGDDVRVWAKGASFDCAILAEAYHRCGLPVPWKFRNERDLRTLAAVTPKDEGSHKVPVAHTAWDDAVAQAAAAARAFRKMGILT